MLLLVVVVVVVVHEANYQVEFRVKVKGCSSRPATWKLLGKDSLQSIQWIEICSLSIS